MTLPRWTAYVALAAIFAMALVAFPRRKPVDPTAGPSAPAEASHPRVVVLGIDGMDPDILRDVMDRYPDRMRNFRRLADEGGVHALGTSIPPQSPVAWSNFITGMNPGGHGIFDFIHRNTRTRHPAPSTATDVTEKTIPLWGEWQFPMDEGGDPNRSGDAFWTILRRAGVPADVWRMPANFPVEPSKGLSFSGMMTPAIDSAYGECFFYTTDPPVDGSTDERIIAVTEYDGKIDTRLTGPPNSFKKGRPAASIPLTFLIDREANAVAIDAGGAVVIVEPGQWSEFLSVNFDLLPMGMMGIGGTVRFYLRSIEPEFELYASPVNIDPSNPVAPVSEPEDASALLADRSRGGIGPYYTQGMPEDVNALKRSVLTVPEFMEQASLVHEEGERMMDWALDHYLEEQDGGVLFYYYSSIDLCMHMMWRLADVEHPHHDPVLAALDSADWSGRDGSTWKDIVDDLYLQMDPILGRLRERIGADTTLIVMSDHGFASYARKFSLNTWLLENGYLVMRDGFEKELPEDDPDHEMRSIFAHVDWTKTRAYGMGFNGLYLNLAGREADNPDTDHDESGIVQPGAEAEALLEQIRNELLAIRDEDGTQVVLRADLAAEAYSGSRVSEAPDIVVGYNAGYGNSDEASTGQITHHVLTDNLGGTFNGSHLMAPDVVSGILMSNRPIRPGPHSLEDLTVEVLAQYGVSPGPGMKGHRVLETTTP